MNRRGAYLIVALVATAPLVACDDARIFDRVDPGAGGDARKADWPLLADTPATPPQGVFTEAAPDPATGEAMQIELTLAAERAERRRRAIAGPVE